MKKFFSHYYPLLIPLLLGLTLRVTLLFTRGTLWFDEYFSIHFSTLPSWTQTLKYWVLETNPPLYTFFLRYYIAIFGDTELILRAASLIFGILSISLLYLLTEKLFSKKTAFFSALLLALSALHLVMSTEIRVYSALAFLTILSFGLFFRLIAEKKEKTLFWALAVNLLLLYSHLTALAIILIQFILINVSSLDNKNKRKWLWGHIVLFALFSLWLAPSIFSKLNFNLGNAWYFNISRQGVPNLLYSVILPISGSLQNHIINTLVFVFLFILAFILARIVKNTAGEKHFTIISILLWALLPIFFSSILGVYVPKYLIISYPAIYILIALALDYLTRNKKQVTLALAAIFIIIAPASIAIVSSPVFSWRPLADYIREKENDNSIILLDFSEKPVLEKYYQGPTPLVEIYIKEDNLSLDEKIVRHNWHLQETSREELHSWMGDKLKNNNVNKIFYIQKFDDVGMMHNELFSRGWQETERLRAPGYYDYYLFEFDAPSQK